MDHETRRRIDAAYRSARKPLTPQTPWWYLSFATETGFLGGVIVQGDDFPEAWARTKLRRTNPGGEVRGLRIQDADLPPESYRNRLLTKEEIDRCWPGSSDLQDLPDEIKAAYERDTEKLPK